MLEPIVSQVIQLCPINPFVYRVRLKLPHKAEFSPGQYLKICLTEENHRPFSIAAAPGSDEIELHIGASAHDATAMEVIHFLQLNPTVRVLLPFGEAQLRTAQPRPILVVVGGTGYAYAKSLIEGLLAQPQHPPITLYWGGRNLASLYDLEDAQRWAAQHPQFELVPVLEEAPNGWLGETGLVHQAVLDNGLDLSQYDVYVAGRFEMAAVIREQFSAAGLPAEQLFGDAYSFI